MNSSIRHQTSSPALLAVRLAFVASVLALMAAIGCAAGPGSGEAAAASPAKDSALSGERPNFVVIQTDDQTLDQLYATYTPPGGAPFAVMPNTLELIAGKGVTFNRYYVPYPLDSPPRVSLMTGRYNHNNNVRGNVQPTGGFPGFMARGAANHNLPIWLQNA